MIFICADVRKLFESNPDLVDTHAIEDIYKRSYDPSYGTTVERLHMFNIYEVFQEIDIDPLDYLESVVPHMFNGARVDKIIIPKHIKSISTTAFNFCTINHLVLEKFYDLTDISFFKGDIHEIEMHCDFDIVLAQTWKEWAPEKLKKLIFNNAEVYLDHFDRVLVERDGVVDYADRL